MIEIRIHGRGGQGSVTAAALIAAAAFYDGKYSQAFPNFGVERRGAPVTAFARIDNKFIRLRSQITEPDYIIIQDASLIGGVDVFLGAKKGTVVLINTEKSAKNFKVPPPAGGGIKIITVKATEIARQIIGQPIINTVLLGVFAGRSGLIKLSSVEKAIAEQFSDKEIAHKNIEAARRGYSLARNF
ncbi:MAG: pyruvate ferredoxin oxidoreductase subunit gamma [Patescibacteria group bacterium]